jgi:hypothetical protein
LYAGDGMLMALWGYASERARRMYDESVAGYARGRHNISSALPCLDQVSRRPRHQPRRPPLAKIRPGLGQRDYRA